MQKFEEKEKFEFVLSINDNIICQRFFTVRNHNPKTDVSKLQEENEIFTIMIKKGNHVIMERTFSADLYPPRVRYSVDIRPQISYILRELTDVLSLKNPETYYLDKQL